MEVAIGYNSRIVELPPSAIVEYAGPLLTELFARHQTYGYSVRSDWSWFQQPNYNLHQIFRTSFTVPASHDTPEGWQEAFKRALRDTLADAEWAVEHGIRHVNAEGPYPVCSMGGYEDEQLPELTRESAVIRWLRPPQLRPERNPDPVLEGQMPGVQGILMEFTLLPFHGKTVKSETIDRIES